MLQNILVAFKSKMNSHFEMMFQLWIGSKLNRFCKFSSLSVKENYVTLIFSYLIGLKIDQPVRKLKISVA